MQIVAAADAHSSGKCPVIVIGGGVGSLGVVRSLAPARTRIVVADALRLNAAHWSRHCESIFIRKTSGAELIADLERIRPRFSQAPLLLPTQDATVETLSRERARLKPHFRFMMPSREAVEILNDKGRFHEFAVREGFPVPQSLVATSQSDITALDTMPTPVIVKPARKASLQPSELERARRFETIAAAKAHCTLLLNAGAGAIVQRWIEGPDDGIFFCLFYCDETGTPLRLFTGRKLSSYPPGVGSTATCIAAPEHHAVLGAITARLTSRIGFAGIGGLEFKRDARTGDFQIIEPTVGRIDWQEEIATLSGFNVPLAAYLHATGQQVSPATFDSPVVAWRSSLRHRVPVHLRTTGTRIVDGYWRAADPLPGLVFYGLEPMRRVVNRVALALRNHASDEQSSPSAKVKLRG